MRRKRKWNLNARIMSALRRLSMYDPAAKEAMKRALVCWGQYKCAHCRKLFGPKAMQKDHILPVVKLEGFDGNWTEVIQRLFPGPDGYQILCHPCHTNKTQRENKERTK